MYYRWGYITVHYRTIRYKTVHHITARYRTVHYKTVHYITVQHYKTVYSTNYVTYRYSHLMENVIKQYSLTKRYITENGSSNA
jgi:hypothetical protein